MSWKNREDHADEVEDAENTVDEKEEGMNQV
jgi:hypothetical protein